MIGRDVVGGDVIDRGGIRSPCDWLRCDWSRCDWSRCAWSRCDWSAMKKKKNTKSPPTPPKKQTKKRTKKKQKEKNDKTKKKKEKKATKYLPGTTPSSRPPPPPTPPPTHGDILQAWNHLGAAAELAGQGTQAVTAYRRAVGLLKEQGARFQGSRDEPEETKELLDEALRLGRSNLGRALVREGQAEEAVSLLAESDLAEVCGMDSGARCGTSTSFSA